MTDLLFRHALAHDTDLVFGAAGSPSGIDAHISIAAALPAIRAQVQVAVAYSVQIAAVLPIPTASVAVQYRSEASRPIIGTAADAIQVAERAQGIAIERAQLGATVSAPVDVHWQEAEQLGQVVEAAWSESMRARSACAVRFQRAIPTERAVGSAFQDAVHRRIEIGSQFEQAQPTASSTRSAFQDAYRDRRLATHSGFADGHRALASISRRSRPAASRRSGSDSRFQNARKPLAGIWIAPTVPIPGRYVPPPGTAVDLLFDSLLTRRAHLVFGRGGAAVPAPIVIPVLRTYIMINSASLIRVSNNLTLPASAITMSIDRMSPQWSWSATLPLRSLSDLEPNGADAVELLATANGVSWRLVVDDIVESEQFRQATLRIGGRGIAAALSAPSAPAIARNNALAATAQQLAIDALTINGVPTGWSLDWQLPDWLIPAGGWSHLGTAVDAVSRIAAAAGGYVQAAASTATLRVLPRYPVAPWGGFSDAIPDIVLPAAAVHVRGARHLMKPAYDVVYIAGQGTRARVIRTGTAGGTPAPQVVDELITAPAPARARGLAVIGDTGAQQILSLETGIFSSTGAIQVGSIIDFMATTAARRGITTSLSVSAHVPRRGPVTVRQLIEVECHD